MELQALEVLQNEIGERETRRAQAINLMRQALSLLDGNGQEIPQLVPIKGKRERRGYIDRVVELLEQSAKPLGPADMTRLLRKREDFKNLRREQIERAIWIEMRKGKPRIQRVSVGLYGLAKQRKSA